MFWGLFSQRENYLFHSFLTDDNPHSQLVEEPSSLALMIRSYFALTLFRLVTGHFVWESSTSYLHGISVCYPVTMDYFLNRFTCRSVVQQSVAFFTHEHYLSYLMKQIRTEEYCAAGKTVTPDSMDSVPIKVMSYNILSPLLLEKHRHLYSRQDGAMLQWQARLPKIIKQITEERPDILCLQEVESQDVTTTLSQLQDHGYVQVFKQKTGELTDGCAIYFKEDKFKLEDVTGVEFYQPVVPVLNRHNVGVVIKLSLKNSPKDQIVVATTHLLFNPRRGDVRLAQTQMMLAEIHRMSNSQYPVLLTGDFNSFPNSEVVTLIETGKVGHSFYQLKDIYKIGILPNCQIQPYVEEKPPLPGEPVVNGWSDTPPGTPRRSHSPKGELSSPSSSGARSPSTPLTPTGSSSRQTLDSPSSYSYRGSKYFFQTVTHGLNLRSLYPHSDGSDYFATTYQNQWVAVDYIFYSKSDRLQLVSRARLPTARECSDIIQYLPNWFIPSDHLHLSGTFILKLDQARRK